MSRNGIILIGALYACAVAGTTYSSAQAEPSPLAPLPRGEGDAGSARTRARRERVPERSFVLRAKVVRTAGAESQIFSPGYVIVRNSKIAAVGADAFDVEFPPDLPVVELRDATVTPGLIAAAANLIPAHVGDESIAAGYRAVDAFDNYDDWKMLLSGGVTTVHLNPGGHRLVSGQGAVVRLGGPMDQRVLREQADLTLNLGEPAFDPPRDVTYQTPASSDVAIPPAIRQRPLSRLGQFLALEEALQAISPLLTDEQAAADQRQRSVTQKPLLTEQWHTEQRQTEQWNTALSQQWNAGYQASELARAWERKLPLRVQVQRGADIRGAVEFLKKHERQGYIVGGAQADVAAGELRAAQMPIVFMFEQTLRGLPGEVGFDPESLERDLSILSRIKGVPLALGAPERGPVQDLRLAAATAMRAGLTEQEVIAAITSTPAEILGVGDRVGRIAPGLDADLAVFNGNPLSTSSHVQRVYVAGEVAFEAPDAQALVVKAAKIWINEDQQIENGAILIEEGKVAAVGRTVPHPPFARVIDAGPGSFVTPGFIDAFGHLGLEGDRSATTPELCLAGMVGVPDVTEKRVARAGVTTVVTAPYSAATSGSQISAIKTAGDEREQRVVRDTAGIYFDMRDADPADVGDRIKNRLKAGKEYLEKWQKYEKELAEWQEKKAKGELDKGEAKSEAVKEVENKADPITGTWELTLSGGPIPEPQTATMKLRLSGSDIEGRLIMPGQAEEAKIVATFDGKHISGRIEVDTPFGNPTIEADLMEEDHIAGSVTLGEFKIDLDARRTDKSDVEFKIVSRKTRGKGGRPLPPPIDEGLEPVRAALEKKIPLLIATRTEVQIDEVLKAIKEYEVAAVLLDADGATVHADALIEAEVGVVVPTQIVQKRNEEFYHQADDLSRKGVAVAFQSDAEDAARALPLLGLHAVERGMSADAALAAFTTEAARMYKLDDRIGSLEPGREGDLVIFSGHPFEAGNRIERVIISGKEVP